METTQRSAPSMSGSRELFANLRVVLTTFEVTFKHAATDTFILFGVFVQPVIIAVLALFMLRGRGEGYAIFVVVGSGLTGLWGSVLFDSGQGLTWERWSGTLDGLVGAPTPMPVIVFGKNLAYVTLSIGSMLVAYPLGSWFAGFPLTIARPGLFLASLVLAVFSFVCLGLLLAPMFVANPDVSRFVNGLEYPVHILAGFLFPVALLPGWTTPLSYLLAPYWAAQALHAAASGGVQQPAILIDWGLMLGLGLVYLVLSGLFFRAFLRKARRDATLSFM